MAGKTTSQLRRSGRKTASTGGNQAPPAKKTKLQSKKGAGQDGKDDDTKAGTSKRNTMNDSKSTNDEEVPLDRVQAEHLTIDAKGITYTEKYRLPGDGEWDPWREKITSLDLTTPSEMNTAVKKLLQTTKFVYFTVKLNLNDPAQLAIIENIPSSGAYRIDVFHVADTPLTIDSDFINETIPWNMPLESSDDTYLNLYYVKMHPNRVRQLYERAKKSSFLCHRFHLYDATAIAKKLMGIDNFTFEKFKKNTTQRNTERMTTYLEDTEVYHTEHDPIRFLMKDGECEAKIKRTPGQLLEVEMKNTPYYNFQNPAFKMIPFAEK